MPKTEYDFQQLLEHYQEMQGWSDSSQIIVLLRFIAETGDYQKFAQFLQRQADDENRSASMLGS